MEVIDMDGPVESRFLKALVYGKSGTGKTGFGVSAPDALILLNERHAIPHIRAHEKRIGRRVVGVLHMKNVDDYRNVIKALHGDRTKPFVIMSRPDGEGKSTILFESKRFPKTVVLDSLTELMDLLADEIRRESPPKVGKDGLPVDSERYWNVLRDRATKMIRSFRDVDMNVLFLCLLDDRLVGPEEGPKTRWVGPQLSMRALPGVVQSCVNVVGVTRRTRNAKKESVYGISTQGGEFMELKPFPPIRADEIMDFSSWVDRINGVDDGSVSPNLDDETSTAVVVTGGAETEPLTPDQVAAVADASKIEVKDIVDAGKVKAKPEKKKTTTTTETAPTAQEAQT